MSYFKDQNREMLFLFFDKVKETGDNKYIPYLEAWKEIDFKKVKAKIQKVIDALDSNRPVDGSFIQGRETFIQKKLEGAAP